MSPDETAATPRAHFNHAGTSIPPPQVLDRVIRHLHLEADMGGYEAAEAVADEADQIGTALAALVGAAPDEVVPTESATRGWEQALWSLALSRNWGSGDRVVVDRFAYASSWATLGRLRDALGVDIGVAPSGADGAVDVSALLDAVDERTRMVLVTHIPTHLGTVSDVAAVGAALSGRDVVYAVDLAQSLGQLPIDVAAIGCQIAFAPGRKFLRAPRGTGLLYVEAALAEALAPLSADQTSTTVLDAATTSYRPAATRFDLFEHSLALRLGLAEAARHATSVGLDRISVDVGSRTAAVADAVAATPGAQLLAPLPLSGIVTFTHERLAPEAVRDRLQAHGVRSWVSSLGGSPLDQADRLTQPALRLSPHYVTTDAEIEVLRRALADLP
jgi:selenocysteine lyase/cysteine desulfurase